MATFNSNMSRYTRLQVVVTPDSPDIANNRTYVRVVVNIVTGTYAFAGQASGSVTVNETSIWSPTSSNYSSNKTHQVATSNFYVSHNGDGTKSIPIVASYSSNSGGYGPINLSINTTMTLPTIPRKSDIYSFSDYIMGDNIWWNVTRKAPSFTHHIKITVGTKTIIEQKNLTTNSGTIIISNANKIDMLNELSKTSKWAYSELTVWTYSSTSQTAGNLVGVATKRVKATANDDDIRPLAFYPTVTKAGDFVEWGNSEIENYVQGKSKAKIVSSATARYGATITEYRNRVDDKHYYGKTITTDYLNVIGQRHIQFRVTDSRGLTATQTDTTSVYVYEYYSPTVNRFNVERLTGERDVKISYQWLMSSINGENYKYLWLQYRKEGESSWRTTYLESRTPTAYTETKTLNKYGIIDGDNTWEFRLWLRDSYTDTFIIDTIGSAFQLMNWNASGKGLAIGQVSTEDSLQIAMPTKIANRLDATTIYENNKRVALYSEIPSMPSVYVVDEGKRTNGYYRKWSSGTMEQWCTGKTLTIPTMTLVSAIGLYQAILPKLWFPLEFVGDLPYVDIRIHVGEIVYTASRIVDYGNFTFRTYATTNAGGSGKEYMWYAVGRWKV